MAGLQRVLCKMYSRDSRYSEYAADSQYNKIFSVSGIGILICQSFTGYIDRLNIPQVMNVPEFSICSGNIFKLNLIGDFQM